MREGILIGNGLRLIIVLIVPEAHNKRPEA